MDKRKNLITVLAFLAGFALGPAILYDMDLETFVPPLTVIGDVGEFVTVRSLAEIGEVEEIRLNETGHKAVKLTELINKAKPAAAVEKIYITASDGFTAAIAAESLEQSYILFSPLNGWEVSNPQHPQSTNVKMIREIVVASDGSAQNGFSVINGKDILNLTLGQLYTGPLTSYPYFEGRSTIEHGNIPYEADVYTRRRGFQLRDLVSLDSEAKTLLLGENGASMLVDNSGFYELAGNQINYMQREGREKMEKVRCAVVNPPLSTITDIYYDSQHYLECGENVLFVMLDGLSYDRYEYAVEHEKTPFLQKNTAVKSVGLYPLKADVWQSAMFTGIAPYESGLWEREGAESEAEAKEETLFTLAEGLGKKALLLERNGLLNPVEWETVADANGSGSADDEIYRRLLENMNGEYSFMAVRFGSIAENEERFGEQSAQTQASIEQIDAYLSTIADGWQGKIFVAGLPRYTGNAPLSFPGEDLFVPYLLISGKNQE